MQENPGKDFFHLPESLPDDLEKMKQMVAQFQDGTVSATQLQVFRVPQGVYEQRESGKFMLRIRLPAGGLFPEQMRALAEVSTTHGNGVLHVTTRQDIQVHRVELESVHPALTVLAKAGLSAKGGGGNTVRNITACGRSGVCPHEAFDVTGHAVALTECLLADPGSFQLPRKYKISFSGCGRDCAGATVNDLGLIAKVRDGREGFAVWVGGGMGARSAVSQALEPWVPAEDIFSIAEAVKRVFDQHGNRKDRHKARLRFLIRTIGLEAFCDLYRKELAQLRSAGIEHPAPRAIPQPPAAAPGQPAEAPERWRRTDVVAQKQDGYYLAEIPLFLGDVSAEKLAALADVVAAHGERMLRTTQWQNLVIRWVREEELGAVHEKLAALGLAPARAPIVRDIVACTGASTCRLGICLARGLARAVDQALEADGIDLDGLGNVKIQISGCPNACGRHPIADIGLFGNARRIGGRLVPHYVVQLGGKVAEGETRLAEGRDTIPARNVPNFLVELLRDYQASADNGDFAAYLAAGGRSRAEQLAARYKPVPDFVDDRNYYFDWGAEERFSLAGRGPGECGAGVFDLIQMDLNSAHEALGEKRYQAAAALAARALLVTRGRQPAADAESLRLFDEHFLQAGLVDAAHGKVIDLATRCAAGGAPPEALAQEGQAVAALVAAVKDLFDNMDASLRFSAAAKDEPAGAREAPPAESSADLQRDFRGVACPLNYVKTKLALDQIACGQVLSITLDEQGAKNVPDSAANDGHEVLSVDQEGDHWRVVIRKG